MPNDVLSDADVGLGAELTDSDVGLEEPKPEKPASTIPISTAQYVAGGGPMAGMAMLPPAPDIPRVEGESTAGQIGAAGVNLLSSAYNAAKSPLGLGLAVAAPASPIVGTLAGLGFGIPAIGKGLYKAYQYGAGVGNLQTGLEGAGEAELGALMTLGGAKGVSETLKQKGLTSANKVKGTSGLPPEQQGVPPERPTEGQAETGTPQRSSEGEQPLPQPAEVQKEVEKAAPTEQPGVPQPSAGPIGATVEAPVAAGETPQAMTETATPEQPKQVGSVTQGVTESPELPPQNPFKKYLKRDENMNQFLRRATDEELKTAQTDGQAYVKWLQEEQQFRIKEKDPTWKDLNPLIYDADHFATDANWEITRRSAEKQASEPPPQIQGMGGAISQGPGAASPGDIPNAPRIAQASTSPIERPFGNVSSFSVALNNIHDALANIGSTIKGIAGESLPRITKSDREVGEAGVRYASSRIAAKPIAQTFATKALQGTDVDPIKFGAALVEDNLRSIRESLRQDATKELADGHEANARDLSEKADRVATMIGAKNSPFQTEEAYLDYLQEPNVKQAVKQHIQLWDEVVDPQFRAAMNIDPDIELPSRGQQTGARVNLRAVFPEDPASNPIRGVVGSNLTGTFRRKSPFGAQAKGTGETYDINYGNLIQNTFERQLEIANKNKFDNMLVNKGLAVIDSPGKQVIINGKPAVGFPLSRRVLIIPKKGEPTTALSQAKNIYVRSDLANEYEGAAGVGSKWRTNWFTKVANVINRAALSGLTDATVHVSNQLTALLDRPTSGKLLTDSLLSATGRADALVTVVRGIVKAFQDNREQISQLSEIGAMRPQDIHFGLFGRALQKTDQVTRLLLDDTFKRLVDSGLVENTETARREYVNQIGQYNRRLQGKITRLFRDTGIGPFVTAGKTFNSLGVRVATLNPGAKGSNLFAAAALRANILSKWVGASVLLGTLNYLMTHKKGGGVLGRPGTPIGNLDLGTNDKSGKQQSFPLFSVLGLGRALRVTGASGAINAKRLGLPNADAAESASRDIINAWSAPFAGPPVKFGAIAATGYSPAVEVGRTSRIVPPGDNQRLENVKEALRQASPVVQSYLKYRSNKPISEVLSSQVPRFTMTPGKTESMVEKYPKIVSMAQGNAFIDDMIGQARKLPKEERRKFVNEQVLRLPPEQRAHGRNEAVRRRVYTN